MKNLLFSMGLLFSSFSAMGTEMPADANNFYQSQQLTVQKVSFNNQYRMKVAGNLYLPKDMDPQVHYPAIIVGHPMGAVKEQSANLYAQKMAEQGFVTLSLDLSFWGESAGEPRNAVAPESTPRTSAPPWTSSARAPSSTASASA